MHYSYCICTKYFSTNFMTRSANNYTVMILTSVTSQLRAQFHYKLINLVCQLNDWIAARGHSLEYV